MKYQPAPAASTATSPIAISQRMRPPFSHHTLAESESHARAKGDIRARAARLKSPPLVLMYCHHVPVARPFCDSRLTALDLPASRLRRADFGPALRLSVFAPRKRG
jgi:hypothetical protein